MHIFLKKCYKILTTHTSMFRSTPNPPLSSRPGNAIIRRSVTTIEFLPDNVLLEMFLFYRLATQAIDEFSDAQRWYMDWHKLVHVCRKWRGVFFYSPVRLDLQLFCTAKTPARKLLSIWPVWPLVVECNYSLRHTRNPKYNFDNVIAALEHHNRVRHIRITSPPDSVWEQIVTVTEEPFPELRTLRLVTTDKTSKLHLPNTFLDGSAPLLQHLHFSRISYPALPKLLRTATDLTTLYLNAIPSTAYVRPEDLASCLSRLPRLEDLTISFESPNPHPRRRNRPLPPKTRTTLSALTSLSFTGVCEYFEILAARINAPRLNHFRIFFFNQLEFDVPQTARFISDLEWFKLVTSSSIEFLQTGVNIVFTPDPQKWSHTSTSAAPTLKILGKGLDWQVFSAMKICDRIGTVRTTVEGLDIKCPDLWEKAFPSGYLPDDMNPAIWLQLFHSFPKVKRLTISDKLEPAIAAALQGSVQGSAGDIFPRLESISISGAASRKAQAGQQGIQSFVIARQHSDHPVVVERPKFASWI
jgi:hypothetical protein